MAAENDAQRFASPEDAVAALIEAARQDGNDKIAVVFGSGYQDLFSSGDEVEDKNNRAEFLKLTEKWAVEKDGSDKANLQFGPDGWVFPVPLIKTGEQWQFDAEQGKAEILNRRIGRNELNALAVMKAYVEAQVEYAHGDHDGDEVAEYATKLSSEPGKFDGLYWDEQEGHGKSPLGPLVAQAKAEGYKPKSGSGTSIPYHGYYYKILTRQGSNAPGGKYDYIINGNMIAGFGLLAFPAEYGSSGIMTFVVNHQGKIYQKNLGEKTAELAQTMKSYDPDATWEPVEAEPRD